MMNTLSTFGVVVLTIALIGSAYGEDSKLRSLPQELEMRLALSAAPAHWRDLATVHVLDVSAGVYTIARKPLWVSPHESASQDNSIVVGGKMGVNCLVGRTRFNSTKALNEGIIQPVCFDDTGSKFIMPVWLEAEKLRANGLSKSNLRAAIAKKFETGEFSAPVKAGVSAMISPVLRVYPSPDAKTPILLNYPHWMFYAPGVTAIDIGSGQLGDPKSPWIGATGPHGMIILAVGEAERNELTKVYGQLILDFCAFEDSWCRKRNVE